jgi:anaerobic selenocysteine-containing dehydrogenase
VYTSGQSNIPEGCGASKLMKGAIGTNNLECNTRLCMISVVGVSTHKLSHGVVINFKDREMAARIWKVPIERISVKPTYHATEMFRAIDGGDIKFI